MHGNLQLVAQPATLGKEFIIPPQHCREYSSSQHPADMQPKLHQDAVVGSSHPAGMSLRLLINAGHQEAALNPLQQCSRGHGMG